MYIYIYIYIYVETYGISFDCGFLRYEHVSDHFFSTASSAAVCTKWGGPIAPRGRTAAKKLQNGALGEANYGETCGLW